MSIANLKVAGLLALNSTKWAALTEAELIEWAKDHFTVTRPSEKQVNKAAVLKKLKKAGISPNVFAQPKAPKPRVETPAPAQTGVSLEMIEFIKDSVPQEEYERLLKMYEQSKPK